MENIYTSYKSLLSKLDLIENINSKIIFKSDFKIKQEDYDRFMNCENSFEGEIKKIIKDYKEVAAIISPIKNSRLDRVLKDKRFAYIKEIVIYLNELKEIRFDSKVAPSFEEDFYTNLGEMAFDLYTKSSYTNVLNQFKCESILDIGCGNGNFIDLFYKQYPNADIIGIERQNKVYKKLMKKYQGKDNIEIINKDVLEVKLEKSIDLVNISYMLFYLSFEQKVKMFKALEKILNKDGKIIICQYYPKFEAEQEVISRHLGTWTSINKFKYSVANDILYAEVLLNDALIDFNKSEEFDEFKKIIKEARLQIKKIYPADDTYYSYFIIITRRD